MQNCGKGNRSIHTCLLHFATRIGLHLYTKPLVFIVDIIEFKEGNMGSIRNVFRTGLAMMSAMTIGILMSGSAVAEKIVIATGADPCFGTFYVPHAEGVFKEKGLDVELVTGSSGSRQVPFIISGDFHFAMGSGGACMKSHVLEPDMVAMFASGGRYKGYDGVVATQDIKGLKGLVGKKIGLALGTGSEVFFTTLAEKEGISMDQFQTINVEAPEMVAALERGDIDAYAAWEPWVSRGVQAIKNTHVVLSSEGLWEPSNAICGNKAWAEKNPEKAKLLFEAMAETSAKMENDKDWAAGVISDVIKLDPELSNSITKKCTFITHLDQADIDNMVNDYNNLVARDAIAPNPTKEWWGNFLYDKALKAAAPANVSYKMPGK